MPPPYDHLNWPYGSPDCLRSGGSCEGPVSKPAVRPVDSERSSVSRRSCLTRTSVTVVVQVARSMAGQGLVGLDLEHDALPHRKTVQLAEHRRDVIRPPSARNQPGDGVLN